MATELLTCEQVGKSYWDGNHDLQVLQGVNLALNEGELLAIVGSSGSGKSTLLHCMGGLDKPSIGKILFRGNDLAKWSPRMLADWRNQHLGFVYQFHHLLPEFNALENIAMPLLISGKSASQARHRATQLLERVGLADRGQHRQQSFPAVNGSVWRSPVPWRTTPHWCWRMNLPGTWTMRRRGR